jgi:hypothetical protein
MLIVLLNYVEKLNCLLKIWWEEGKKRKEQTICFVLQRKMQGNLFIPESWMEMATWVEEIQLVAMEITKGKPCRVGCTIQRLKQHHENHKHESFFLTPNLLLDITCNPRHELELDLWEFEKIRKKKLQARKEKKMARVKPYEKM